MSTIIEDSQGNAHFGTRGTPSTARITVDFGQDNVDCVGLDVAPNPNGASERAAIKIGDYTFAQDSAKNGTKDLVILDGDGLTVASIASGGTNGSVRSATELFRSNIPLIIAPTGSIADGGVNTSGTANPLTYLKTYTWFPLGALYGTGTTPASAVASPAGWYYAVWTTTTSCQVYANTWDGISSPTIPATLTALPVALTGGIHKGPGAFTGPTTEFAPIILPFVASKLYSRYEFYFKHTQTNNANVKTAKGRFSALAGTTLWTSTLTSFLENDAEHQLILNGVADKQQVTGKTFGSTAFVRTAAAMAAEATSAAAGWGLAYGIARATATDVLVIENFQVLCYR